MHLTSYGTLVILITSTGEFLSYFTIRFSFVSFHCKKRKVVAGLFLCYPVFAAEIHS